MTKQTCLAITSINANKNSYLIGSQELSAGCSGCLVSTCPPLSARGTCRRGPAGRYSDRQYRYEVAATITQISPTRERILHCPTQLLTSSLLTVTNQRPGVKKEQSSSSSRLHIYELTLVSLSASTCWLKVQLLQSSLAIYTCDKLGIPSIR